MKKLIFIFCLFFVSCEKESYDVDFVRFGYCRVPNGVDLSFVVNENKFVKSYSLEGGSSPFGFQTITSIKSYQNYGEQTYKVNFSNNNFRYYRIRVNFRNKKTQYSNTFGL